VSPFSVLHIRPLWRWVLWVAFVVAWTTLLVSPARFQGSWPLDFAISRKEILAKAGHFMGYAAFAVLSGWLVISSRSRLLLLFFLMLHAAGTELAQQIPGLNRSGEVRDVVLNHLGILIGLLLSWKLWTREQ
jgi:VanZ family protein